MSKINEVQDFIVGYLKENGASYINELYEASGASKDTFYKALNNLIDDEIVTTYRDGKRRYVKLISSFPGYLKSLTAITIAVLFMMYVSTLNFDVLMINFGKPYPIKYPDTSFFYMILMFFLGLWTGIFFFRQEDLESAYLSIKIRLSKMVSLVRR